MSSRVHSLEMIVRNLEQKIIELEHRIVQLQEINHDALLRNCEMAKELREYQKQKQYKELIKNG